MCLKRAILIFQRANFADFVKSFENSTEARMIDKFFKLDLISFFAISDKCGLGDGGRPDKERKYNFQ